MLCTTCSLESWECECDRSPVTTVCQWGRKGCAIDPFNPADPFYLQSEGVR